MFKNDIKIDNKMKTIITRDWLKEFPSYKKNHPEVLEKRVGPLVLSIWYDVDWGTDIKIYFTIFNIANPQDFMSATLKVRPKSRRDSLTWKQHEEGKYKEAAEELRQLSLIPIEGPVKLSQIINAYKSYPNLENALATERNFEDPALIAAWAGKLELAKALLDWGRSYYEKRFKVRDSEEWYQSMLKKISDPEGLRKTVEEQVIFHKLEKLPYEDLIIDMD